MDKIRALRYFKRVAELHSFSLAAQEFDVPPSSVSRRIRDLENELGVELIKRTTRNVSTTELGNVYYDFIVDALKTIDDADELVSQRVESMEGKLRISTSASYGEKVLAPILHKFRQQYPAITLDIDFSDERVSFGKDTVDIAIRAGHIPEDRVIAKPLSSAEFKLVATPTLVERLQKQYGKQVLSLDDLESCPTLQYRGVHGLFTWWALNGKTWDNVAINPVLRCNNDETLLEAALAHDGLALYPLWWVKEHLDSGELMEVPVEVTISSRQGTNLDIFILYHQTKYQIPKIKRCVDFILQQLGN